MSKEASLRHLENYFKRELHCAVALNCEQDVVELHECLHHLKRLTGEVDFIGGHPVVDKVECNTWITDFYDDLYVVRVHEALFNELDIADELATCYYIEDGCEQNGKFYFLVKYVGE